MNEPVEQGDYGVVKVVKGKHKGKIAYYDDDDGSLKHPTAIVYFGEPFKDSYYEIPLEFLVKTDERLPAYEEWLEKYPDTAKRMGVPQVKRKELIN